MDKYIKYLELEVTETATEGRGADVVNSTLEKLEERGIKLAIDDMGTGQSGLRRLGKLPFKIIKIDMVLTFICCQGLPRGCLRKSAANEWSCAPPHSRSYNFVF